VTAQIARHHHRTGDLYAICGDDRGGAYLHAVRGVAKHGADDFTSASPAFPRQSSGAGAFPVHGAPQPSLRIEFGETALFTSLSNDREEGLKYPIRRVRPR